MNVLIDTNVLLDVLAHRKGHYQGAMQFGTLAESGKVLGHVAAISFSNCYYIVRKYGDRAKAEHAIRLLRGAFTPVDLTALVLHQAIDAGFSEFEDAIQFYSALQAEADCIITRNPDHFPRKPLSVLSPAEFLAAYTFD